MKYLSTILSLLLVVGQGVAQNIEGNFQYRVGDVMRKQVVDYMVDTIAAKNRVWNLQDLEFLDGRRKVIFDSVYNRSELVSYVEKNTRYFFEQRNDSLLAWGHENNLSKEVYNLPIMQLHTPLIYGEKFEGLFHGRKTYCERIFSRVFGKWSVEVDGTGMMLLPEGDTLRNVSRVHLHQEKMVLSYSAITTYEDLTAYVDSIAVFTADSILNEMQNGIRDEVMDVYRWYATGYRYPVLDVILKRKNGQVKTEAYYLSPVSQEELYDAENELIRKQMAEMPSLAYSVSDHGAGSSPMSRCDISVSGQTVKIQFDLTELATVTGLVSDVPGLLLRKQSRNYEAGTDYEMELDCQGLRSGTYVLYLNVNGEVTSHLVNL